MQTLLILNAMQKHLNLFCESLKVQVDALLNYMFVSICFLKLDYEDFAK